MNNPPDSLNVSDTLTEAARTGAEKTRPAWEELKSGQRAKVIKALRKNKRPRLESILGNYARTLDADTLKAIIAEGTD